MKLRKVFLLVSGASSCPSRNSHENGIRNDIGILGDRVGERDRVQIMIQAWT